VRTSACFPKEWRADHVRSQPINFPRLTTIYTYGTETLTLNFGLQCEFTWRFVIADVARPIIAADVLTYYGLLVDLRNPRLVDQMMNLTALGRCMQCDTPGINARSLQERQRIINCWRNIQRSQDRRASEGDETRDIILRPRWDYA